MNQPLSPNAMAILLLTAPLIAGRREAAFELLTLGEYNRLARLLREKQRQPSDLIGPDIREVIDLCAAVFDRARLESLLGRGFLLSQAVDRWSARAIWVVSRADPTYPRRLKIRLREDAPPVLYGCGEAALMETGGLAVVGSRNVDDELIAYSENVGRVAAAARQTLISGGARGVDQAAMHGALRAGGAVVGVLADSLERAALARDNREPLMNRRLVLVSPYDPAAGFNVGHAMGRNKLIYAMADAAVVVKSDFEKGGTWAGAIEQLERLRFVPVFVRNGPGAGKGNSALLRRGARPWPEPQDGAGLSEALSAVAEAVEVEPGQEVLPFVSSTRQPLPLAEESSQQPAGAGVRDPRASHTHAALPAAEKLLRTVGDILSRELVEAHTDAEVAELLAISKPQAKTWLLELVGQGLLEELSEPTRYRTATK
jgi:predicted Rossmann fold nucleotide-binding protein DprA/Smf involved in DNA uptake